MKTLLIRKIRLQEGNKAGDFERHEGCEVMQQLIRRDGKPLDLGWGNKPSARHFVEQDGCLVSPQRKTTSRKEINSTMENYSLE